MKTAIMGAGLTGAYLYRLLVGRGLHAEVFDLVPRTNCGISPCAWGTSRGFSELVSLAGLDPEKYILRRFEHLMMDKMRIRADLMTFDKPGLIKDLLQGAEVRYSEPHLDGFDRIIDATGVARAFLPAIEDDVILPCIQSRIKTGSCLDNRIRLGGVGYAWCFPLSSDEYHIGCGSLTGDPGKILAELGWVDSHDGEAGVRCACTGSIRLTAPHYSQPFVTAGRIWGIGEAIGCVAPLAGDGIIPGMRSARILMECFDDPVKYTNAILSEFRWMKAERRVIDKLRRKKYLMLHDAWVLKKNSRRMGMRVGLGESFALLKHLR